MNHGYQVTVTQAKAAKPSDRSLVYHYLIDSAHALDSAICNILNGCLQAESLKAASGVP